MTISINFPTLVSDSSFSSYLRKINSIPSLSVEEELTLARDYIENNDINAAHKLVVSHLKLVAKIALKYINYGLPIADLVSEGNLGLMHAVKKYQPDLGFRLSTYAMWWIKCYLHEYVLRCWSLVKIGTTAAQKKLFFGLNKIKHKIQNLCSNILGDEEFDKIAKEMNVSKSEVMEMNNRLSNSDISLNRVIGHDDGSEVIDFLPSSYPNPEKLLLQQEISNNKKLLLEEAMKSLTERECEIFKSRNLVDDSVTLDTLSIKYNISKERVRQTESKAFEKVKAFMIHAWSKKYQN